MDRYVGEDQITTNDIGALVDLKLSCNYYEVTATRIYSHGDTIYWNLYYCKDGSLPDAYHPTNKEQEIANTLSSNEVEHGVVGTPLIVRVEAKNENGKIEIKYF
jgi:hypothetical protein